MRIATIRRAGAFAVARAATLRVAIGEPADAASDPELRLAELARSRAPLRRALARIAGRFVATRASDRLGFARLGDWARKRVGLSARQIQDLARVDGRLATLPRIEAVRAKFHRARELARRVAGEALPTWACMEAVAAEALSALGPMPPDEREASCASAALAGAPAANVCATPPPVWVRSLVEGIDDADAFELDDRMRRAVALEQRIEAEMAPLLRTLGASSRYRHAGVGRFEAWARERLGISPRKTRALVRLDRAGDACPALREAFRSGRLSWVQAHALAPILLVAELAPFRDEWVVWAEAVSVRRLEDDVAAALLLLETDRAALAATGGLPERQTCARDPRNADPAEVQAPAFVREDETARVAFVGPRDAAVFFCSVVAAARGRLERLTGRSVSAGEAIEWMLDHALAAWGADDPLLEPEHRVFERDGWRCTMPGCSSYRNLHGHHIVYRSKGGPDDLWNRTTLCACHHQRGVHGGLARCFGSAPEGLRFEIGLRAGRPPLLRYTAGDRRVSARVA